MEPLYARYPFLEAARDAVEAADIDLAELVIAGDAPAVERAIARIEGAVTAGVVPDPIADHRIEVLSYPIARVLVSLVDEPVLIDRYALAEARRAHRLFGPELRERATLRSASGRRLSLADLLDEFDLPAEATETGVSVPVTRYLSLSADLGDPTWRLVHRSLDAGSVSVTRAELEELLREAIRHRVAEGLPLAVPDAIADALGTEVSRVEELLADVPIPGDIDAVEPEHYPPCIGAILQRVRNAEAVSDIEQFALVSFLCAIGCETEELIATLAPESEERARRLRYQAEHVHGATRSTAYPPPSCATMQAADACVDVPDRCDSDGHPLSWYATRLRA